MQQETLSVSVYARMVMKEQEIVTVNGQSYDKRTGMPIDITSASVPTPVKSAKESSGTLHSSAQKSTTLRRGPLRQPKKPPAPTEVQKTSPSLVARPQRRSLDIARHPQVKKISSAPAASKVSSQDIAPRNHPHVIAANQRAQQKKAIHAPATRTITTKEVKDNEIARVLATQTSKPKKASRKKLSLFKRKKAIRLGAIIASIVVVIGIAIWMNLPIISVKFASAQADVAAEFPHFTPDGYTLNLPINANDNEVAITFKSRQNDSTFTLKQSKSAWDSNAVRAMVERDSKGQFLTTLDRGLTVYTYDGNGAWVNKGILYSISGDARLQKETIMRIANSL